MSSGYADAPVGSTALRLDTVVGEALAVVNAGGLESLTMRRLAERLGAHLPTIYRLVDGKDALIDEMAETILAHALSSCSPAEQSGWEHHIVRHARGLRSALLAQRDGARIVGGNYAAKHANLTYVDSLVGCMHNAGLESEHALWAASSVFCYVLGEVLEQQGASGEENETLHRAVQTERYRHLASSPVQRLLDFDARFDFGLRLLIAGMHASPGVGGAPDARP